ncbi:hypothetical protein FA15DRAFT_704729 [Coprinopsis marcescibilis]|uniref:Peptidase M43 pregnancy-associated plasma-A domain-containing protein n=1 Tax=Coprinopsis marcescibilis TaxID=230819 RepID=A0A5C3KVC8_COPMA|nr:hypothetical protein FA15DRAFT_704729 [Coprinopsis marcescibilis]
MKLSILAFVSLALSLDFVRGQGGLPQINTCGTISPSPAERTAQEAQYQASLKAKPVPERLDDVVIPVYYHVTYANQTFAGGYISNQQVQAAFDMLVSGFQGSGFTFRLEEVQRHNNPTWFTLVEWNNPPTEHINQEMKMQTRVGGPRTLNIWTVGMQRAIGYAQYPWDYMIAKHTDGVTMKYDIFPNNGDSYRFGKTLIHEVGHWLGLYHTFEGNSCFGDNDFVADTPAQAQATDTFSGCGSRDTCPTQPGLDPVSNYMDYSSDVCLIQFTQGQKDRMWGQYQTFRA